MNLKLFTFACGLNKKNLAITERQGLIHQGSYGFWKTWKVLEFYYGIFQYWKVLEKWHWYWKVLEIC